MRNRRIGLLRLGFAVIFLVIGIIGQAKAQTADPALAMVKTLRLGANLASISFSAAMMTQTFQGMSYKLGPTKAKEILKKELEQTVPKYQDRWDRNLADSYASFLTREEMDSLTKLKQQSPYASKFRAVQSQAGANMQAKSKDLLTTVISEALSSAFANSLK